MKTIIWLLSLLVLVAAGTTAFIGSGAYNVAADEPHWPFTEYAMEMVRERSIATRASGIAVPDLEDEATVRSGAGNYDAMCVGCHLRPGLERTELSNGLLPSPPNLSGDRTVEPAATFWAIKHGIKMTGMPAWGKSMDDGSIWGMVAFLQRLPDMSEVRYRELVESSEGHAHGSGDEAPDDHDAEPAAFEDKSTTTHVHDDGSQHEHQN